MISARDFDIKAVEAIAESDLFGDDASNSPRLLLVTNDFTEDKNLVYTDFTYANFTGSAAKEIPFGAQIEIVEQESERLGIMLKEPLGGLNFVCTAAPAEPETITGYVVYNGDNFSMIAMHRFQQDQTIAEVGDFVEISAKLGFVDYEMFTGPSVNP